MDASTSMTRRLLNLLTALSLLLCVAVCVLWVHSMSRTWVGGVNVFGRGWVVGSARGWLSADNAPQKYARPDLPGVRHSVRHGYVVAVAAALPVTWGVMRLLSTTRRLRRRPGFCASCGYDLRATPDRCPECGTEPPPAFARE